MVHFSTLDHSSLKPSALPPPLSSMPSGHDLERLMALYQDGDFSAARALIDSLSPQLHRFFSAQLDSRSHADDLLQETWLRIHSIRHTYRRGEPVLPWFYAIARHVRVDHYRKSLRTSAREQSLDAVARSGRPSGRFSQESLAVPPVSTGNELAALLAPLPESQREVITLLKVVGLSLEEVARATSSSVGSVKQKAHRAYNTLREKIVGEKSAAPGMQAAQAIKKGSEERP